MKKFQFRLDRVLQYRGLVKDEKTRELVLARNKAFDCAERLKELEAAALMNKLEENLECTAEELFLISAYGHKLRCDIERQEEKLEEAKKNVEIARAAYIDAAKDEKSLSTLKQHKLDEYRDYLAKEELKSNDELVVQRAGMEKPLS